MFVCMCVCLKILFIHDRHRERESEREREAETQAEGDAGSMQGARCRTRSWDPGSQPEPKAAAHPLSPPGAPGKNILLSFCLLRPLCPRYARAHWLLILCRVLLLSTEISVTRESLMLPPVRLTSCPQAQVTSGHLWEVFSELHLFRGPIWVRCFHRPTCQASLCQGTCHTTLRLRVGSSVGFPFV